MEKPKRKLVMMSAIVGTVMKTADELTTEDCLIRFGVLCKVVKVGRGRHPLVPTKNDMVVVTHTPAGPESVAYDAGSFDGRKEATIYLFPKTKVTVEKR